MNVNVNDVEIIDRSADTKLFAYKSDEILRSTSLCRGMVSPAYARQSVRNADLLVLAYDQYKNNVRGALRGFASIMVMPSGHLYIDVVCRGLSRRTRSNKSEPTGSAMITALKRYVRTIDSPGIVLSSLRHVVGYYKKFGFRLTRDLDCSRRSVSSLNRKTHLNSYAKNFYKNSNLRKVVEPGKKTLATNYGSMMMWCA